MEAITREEKLLSGQQLEPITRKELFLAKAAGMDIKTPEPITREEMFLSQISGGSGGSAPVVEPLSVTANGIYTPPDGVDGYNPVTVNVASGGSSENEWFNDGNTHIWVTIPEGRTSPMLGVCPNGTVTVDWGDGTEPDILTGTSVSTLKKTPNHEYANPGDYVITLTVDGELGFSGSTTYGADLLTANIGGSVSRTAYNYAVKKIEFGNGIADTAEACMNMYGLLAVHIPDSVTTIGDDTFYKCHSSVIFNIPDSVTTIGGSAFRELWGLLSIRIPDSVTTIEGNAFGACKALASAYIPAGVTEIAVNLFSGCSSLRFCDFSKHSVVPSLSNVNAFSSCAQDLEIRVPAALYDEWIAATNWASLAANIVAV